MAGNAYIMTAYNAETEASGTAQIDYVMGTDGTWLPVGTDPTLIGSAATYTDAAFPIEEVRAIQGQFQAKYTDRDVRMERVTVSITYPAV
jgi:hypothetical protein